jgi:hypothetical protein
MPGRPGPGSAHPLAAREGGGGRVNALRWLQVVTSHGRLVTQAEIRVGLTVPGRAGPGIQVSEYCLADLRRCHRYWSVMQRAMLTFIIERGIFSTLKRRKNGS